MKWKHLNLIRIETFKIESLELEDPHEHEVLLKYMQQGYTIQTYQ